jgi:oligoribonuclease
MLRFLSLLKACLGRIVIGIFLDIETTGLDPLAHRVLEIAFKFIDLNSGEVLTKFLEKVSQPPEVWEKSDKTSLVINGFSPDEFENSIDEATAALQIKEIFQSFGIARGKAIFICQNPSFDRAYFSQLISTYDQENLNWPYHWLDFASMYWALYVTNSKQNSIDNIHLSKDKIAQIHGLPTEQQPHRAMNGVDHLIQCYSTVIGYPKSETPRVTNFQ